jgi:putative tryptophan/tyrosine transport system substrate-binding protein
VRPGLIVLLVILALSLLVAPLAAEAQLLGKVPRIGVLELGTPPASPAWIAHSLLWQNLRQLGWLEGQNLVMEYRWANGQPSRLSSLAAELVRLPVDVIVVVASPAIRAVQRATTTIPIVMVSVGDPVEEGFVADLARPGGNISGVGGVVPELSGNLLEFLTEAVPGVTRMAVLAGLANPTTERMVHDIERAAQAFGVSTQLLMVGPPDRFEPAFEAAISEGAGALLVLPSVFLSYHQSQIAALALKNRLPAIYWQRGFAEACGLMAYGPRGSHLWQRAATHVEKILKGAKPADLPVEQPIQFELVVNLKTMKALGLTISPVLLFQADEVIR